VSPNRGLQNQKTKHAKYRCPMNDRYCSALIAGGSCCLGCCANTVATWYAAGGGSVVAVCPGGGGNCAAVIGGNCCKSSGVYDGGGSGFNVDASSTSASAYAGGRSSGVALLNMFVSLQLASAVHAENAIQLLLTFS